MTILKNIVLIATLSLGMPLNTFTFQTAAENNYNYAINTIINYMPLLHQQTTASAHKVITWLNKKLQDQSLTQYDALTIAQILEANTTIDAKITKILHIITIEAKAQSKQQFKNFIDSLFICGVGIACILAIISAAANPHRCIYPDSISTTYTFSNDNFSYTINNQQKPYHYSYSISPTPNMKITYHF